MPGDLYINSGSTKLSLFNFPTQKWERQVPQVTAQGSSTADNASGSTDVFAESYLIPANTMQFRSGNSTTLRIRAWGIHSGFEAGVTVMLRLRLSGAVIIQTNALQLDTTAGFTLEATLSYITSVTVGIMGKSTHGTAAQSESFTHLHNIDSLTVSPAATQSIDVQAVFSAGSGTAQVQLFGLVVDIT